MLLGLGLQDMLFLGIRSCSYTIVGPAKTILSIKDPMVLIWSTGVHVGPLVQRFWGSNCEGP